MHPTYTDLRDPAAQAAALPPKATSSEHDDPFARYREFIDIADPLVDVGWCIIPAASGAVESFGRHELMVVIGGAIALEQAGMSTILEAGESCVIPKGASFTWSVVDSAKLAFMSYFPEETSGSAEIIVLDPEVELSPSGSPLAELLLSETPSCRNNTAYATPTRHWSVGVWDSTPYHRAPMVYGHYELMHILEGSVCITDDQGRSTTFGPDSVFLVPKNAKCSWLSTEHVRKVWGILRIPS